MSSRIRRLQKDCKKRFIGEIELDSLEKVNAIMGNNSGTKQAM